MIYFRHKNLSDNSYRTIIDHLRYVQIEILKIIFRGSRKPTKKCAMKMKARKNDARVKCYSWKEALYKAHTKNHRKKFGYQTDIQVAAAINK